jgi:hypothetical protein
MTWAAAPTSPACTGTTLMTPPFGMSSATGLLATRSDAFQIAGTGAVAVIEQRPRTAKLGRPPRGNHC